MIEAGAAPAPTRVSPPPPTRQAHAHNATRLGIGPEAKATPAPSPTIPSGPPTYESGLRAAIGHDQLNVELGALEGPALALSSLDGAEDAPPEPAVREDRRITTAPDEDDAFRPPDDRADAPELEVDAPPPPRGHVIPQAAAPPDADEATALTPPPEAMAASAPPTVPATQAAKERLRGGTSIVAPPSPVLAFLARLASGERRAFVTGLLLALLVGYLPAAAYAEMAESSRIQAMIEQVDSQQRAVRNVAQHEALPGMRQAAVEAFGKSRSRLVMTTFVIWAASTGALMWVWYRKVLPQLPTA